MNQARKYSWEQAKGLYSFDILDVVPTTERFRALSDSADTLAGQLHNEAGVMKIDATAPELAELAELYEHLARLQEVDYVLTKAEEAENRLGNDHDRIAWTIWRARLMFRLGVP
jgi:hypothetical protein